MSFQFPASPAINDIFTGANGAQYLWTGVVWNQISGNPASLTAEARNRIVNGAMQISQENGNAVGTANGYYPADQWVMVFGTTGTLNIQRVQVQTPKGSKDRFRFAVATADTSLAAGEVALIAQNIEGYRVADFAWGTAQARQVVLRFGWKSPAGTYAVSLQNAAAGSRSYIALFTISAGQANTDTEQTLIIPGDVAGTWPTDNSLGLCLRFTIAAGSSFNGTAGWQAGNFISTSAVSNGLATAGNIFELFDVGLYLDAQATGLPPPFQVPDYADELAACMRYWVKTKFSANGAGYATGAIRGTCYYPVPMRTIPSVTGTFSYANASGGNFDQIFDMSCRVNATVTSNADVSLTCSPLILNARM